MSAIEGQRIAPIVSLEKIHFKYLENIRIDETFFECVSGKPSKHEFIFWNQL